MRKGQLSKKHMLLWSLMAGMILASTMAQAMPFAPDHAYSTCGCCPLPIQPTDGTCPVTAPCCQAEPIQPHRNAVLMPGPLQFKLLAQKSDIPPTTDWISLQQPHTPHGATAQQRPPGLSDTPIYLKTLKFIC